MPEVQQVTMPAGEPTYAWEGSLDEFLVSDGPPQVRDFNSGDNRVSSRVWIETDETGSTFYLLTTVRKERESNV
jgi:hypothetical protein